jgi:hypothetical protein
VSVDCIQVELLESDNVHIQLTQNAKNVFFNTKRYVDVSKIELGSRTFEDVEAGGYENCAFKHYRTTYLFRCKILTTEVERTLPGIVPANNKFKRDEHSEYQLSNLKKT